MCLAFLVFGSDPPQPRLLLAFNRDEFFRRPTKPLHFWEDGSFILGGRDLGSGGTWLGINVRSGRLAFLTNLRSLDPIEPTSHNSSGAYVSRGELVTRFLTGSASPQEYVQSVPRDHYQGFNLVVGDLRGEEDSQVGAFVYINNSPDSSVAASSGGGKELQNADETAVADTATGSVAGRDQDVCDNNNRGGSGSNGSSSSGAAAAATAELLEPGRIYGLSNGRLMEWPKVTSGIRALQELLRSVTRDEPIPYDRTFGELLGDSKRLVPLKTAAGAAVGEAMPASGDGENVAAVAADIMAGRQHTEGDAVAPLTAPARTCSTEAIPQGKGEEPRPVETGAAEMAAAADAVTQRSSSDGDGAASIETYDLATFRERLEHITSGRFVATVQSPWGLYGTRSQTVVVVWHDGTSEVRERYRRDDGTWDEVVVSFRLNVGC